MAKAYASFTLRADVYEMTDAEEVRGTGVRIGVSRTWEDMCEIAH